MMRQLNKNLTAGVLLVGLTLTIFSILSPPSTPTVKAEPVGVSLPEANKVLIHHAFEKVLNDGHLTVADEIFAANFRQHAPNLPAVTLGSEGVKLLTTLYRLAFFNLRYTVEDLVAEGDKVVIHWTASGLHQRAFGLYAPSGKQVSWTGMTIYRIANGQIVEAWTNQDDFSFIKQLGATTLTGATWGPSYSTDGAMAVAAASRTIIGPTTVPTTITWGPAYYADDTNVEVGRNRPELEFMKQVDQQALAGKTWGPSYSTDSAMAVAAASGANLGPTTASTAITWGPSYYADDTNLEVGRHRPELEVMKQVDQQALTGKTWGPTYDH
jgi:predicted ester cyclase